MYLYIVFNFKAIYFNTCIMIPITHWGGKTHIYVSKLIIGSDNDLSPGWRQAIIWSNAGISFMQPLGKNIKWNIYRNSYTLIKKIYLKSAKWQPFCLGLKALNMSTV